MSLPNYFEFFNLPLIFDINQSELKKAFFQSQNKFHPDKLSDKFLANQLSSYANDAYKTLKNPASRAIYWCQLFNINTKVQIEMSMLEKTMKWHENVEQGHSTAILSQVKEVQQLYYEKFNAISQTNDQNLGIYAQTLLMLDRFIENTLNSLD